MKRAIIRGVGFGLTSGIITTLGLIVGLNSGTHSKTVVLGGIFIIAVADALSDALGIHISIESENRYKAKEIWQSTLSTLLSKFLFALSFIVPIILFDLKTAVPISIAWGLLLIGWFSYYIAQQEKANTGRVILEHLLITVGVILASYYVGSWVSQWSK